MFVLIFLEQGNINPGKSWYSVLNQESEIAYILAIYMDDERIYAGYERKDWYTAHQVTARKAYLSIKDEVWKRLTPSQSSGVWAG